MPSFSISQFTILPRPLRVLAEFLLLSTGPLLYLINARTAVHHAVKIASCGFVMGQLHAVRFVKRLLLFRRGNFSFSFLRMVLSVRIDGVEAIASKRSQPFSNRTCHSGRPVLSYWYRLCSPVRFLCRLSGNSGQQ